MFSVLSFPYFVTFFFFIFTLFTLLCFMPSLFPFSSSLFSSFNLFYHHLIFLFPPFSSFCLHLSYLCFSSLSFSLLFSMSMFPILYSPPLISLYITYVWLPYFLFSPFHVSFPLPSPLSLFLSETTLTDEEITSSAWPVWLKKCWLKFPTSSCPTWEPGGSNLVPCHLLTLPVHHQLSTPFSREG